MFHILSRSAAYSAYSAISAFVSSLNIGHGLNPELREGGRGGWMLKSESPCKKNKRLQLVLLCLNKANVHCAHTSKGTTSQTKQNIRYARFYQIQFSTFYNVACIIHIWLHHCSISIFGLSSVLVVPEALFIFAYL